MALFNKRENKEREEEKEEKPRAYISIIKPSINRSPYADMPLGSSPFTNESSSNTSHSEAKKKKGDQFMCLAVNFCERTVGASCALPSFDERDHHAAKEQPKRKSWR